MAAVEELLQLAGDGELDELSGGLAHLLTIGSPTNMFLGVNRGQYLRRVV